MHMCVRTCRSLSDSMVYYWPHIVNITHVVDNPIMVFSLSKLTGMAASRIGWALLDSTTLAFNTIGQQSTETYSISSEAQFRASRVMAQLATSRCEDPLSFVVCICVLSHRVHATLDVCASSHNCE